MNPVLLSFNLERGIIICNAVLINGSFTMIASRVAIDCCASYTILAPWLVKGLNIPVDNSNIAEIDGLTGSIYLPKVVVPQIGILGANARNVDVLVGKLPVKIGLDGVLGYSFLKHFKIITINYEKQELTLFSE